MPPHWAFSRAADPDRLSVPAGPDWLCHQHDRPPGAECDRARGCQSASLLSRGWDIFRNNLGPIIVMAIILAVLGLVAGFIIAIPVFIVVDPGGACLYGR
jgi:hypothetical protein